MSTTELHTKNVSEKVPLNEKFICQPALGFDPRSLRLKAGNLTITPVTTPSFYTANLVSMKVSLVVTFLLSFFLDFFGAV